MRIAFIGQKGIPAKSGGVERHAEELAVQLAKRGHEVFVYVRNNYTDKKIMQYKGVNLVHIPNISTKNLDAISHTFFSMVHALFQSYDVAHVHSIGPNSLNFLLKIFNPNTVLIGTYHCQDYFHQKWGGFAKAYLKLGEYMTCTIPNRTIVVTQVLKNLIWEKFGTEAEMISNGANVTWNEQSDKLAEWNLEKGKYILAVSRIIRHKGLHYLVAAFKELERKNLSQGKKLVIVGDGFYTTDYVKSLKQLAAESENIIFVGAQTDEKLRQLFSHAYFFVQPSDSEGLSIALLEAMGYGKAVIVSNIPENLEAIGEAGVSFSQGNIVDLQEKMADWIANEEEMHAFAEAGKKRARTVYNWEQIAEQTCRVYEEELNKKGNKQFSTQAE
ncbi:MAG: glycosyltransferase family 4 protein [Parcubacteria group bacterium]|jgi:glycosyltransferase involved in cell wall biosynthesis